MILVDTNIALRLTQPNHPHNPAAVQAVNVLRSRDNESFVIAPQSLYEMYVVYTRPVQVNGFGKSAEDALNELRATKSVFALLPDTSQVYDQWEGLVQKYKVTGKRAHDIRLVAVMMIHRVANILTFNDADFRSVAEVQALNPFDVLSLPRA